MTYTTTISLLLDEWKRCQSFGEEVSLTTTKYINNKNVAYDHTIGKMGEIAAYRYLQERYGAINASYPDFDIYPTSMKSFAPDLTSSNPEMFFHVKTQPFHKTERYGISWGFHINDPCIKRPSNKDYGVFVVLANDKLSAEVYEPLLMKDVASLLKLPQYTAYTSHKRFFWADDIGKIA